MKLHISILSLLFCFLAPVTYAQSGSGAPSGDAKLSLKQRKQCKRKCQKSADPRACVKRCAAQLKKTGTEVGCCKAQLARCLACQKKQSVMEYCAQYPDTRGCPKLSGQTKTSSGSACAKDPQAKGCETHRLRERCSRTCGQKSDIKCMSKCMAKGAGQ